MKGISILPIFGVLLIALGTNATSLENAAALATAVDSAIATFQQGVDDGIYLPIPNNSSLTTPLVNLPGGVTLKAGVVALPLDFLCRQPGVIDTLICHVCSYDCTYVHNKYGGQCGTVSDPMPGTPQATGEVCICNDSKPNVANFTDVVTQCGELVDPVVDAVIDLQVAITFRERMFAVQCIPKLLGNPLLGVNSVGCTSDCTQNHQYRNGTCQSTDAVAVFLLETYPGFNCVCSH